MAPLVVNVCINIVKWTPVLFITAVLVWSYYAYVLQLCLFTIDNVPQQVIFLILYHPLYIMVMWSYWKTIFTECGEPPKHFYLSSSDLDLFEAAQNDDEQRAILTRIGAGLPVLNRTAGGDIRFCEKCKCIKPDRAHHCSACGKCILKMDHHCPWVNNCVSFTNYKFFILFLAYALVYCFYIAATSIQYFVKFWSSISGTSKETRAPAGSIQIVFLTLVSFMFSISIITLFGYHSYLVSRNVSTLESFRPPVFSGGPDKNGFSLGKWGNFVEVFGEKKSLWLLPVFSSCGDGVTYPTKVAQPPPSSYHTMECLQTPPLGGDCPDMPQLQFASTTVMPSSYGDGVTYPVRTVDEDFDSLLGQRQRWMEEGTEERVPGYENQAVYGTNR